MFKFTIRELLLLTVIVGLGFGWWIDRSGLATEAKIAKAQLVPYKVSADRWRKIALEFAHLMRDDGWHTKVDDDGSGWGYTHRHNFVSREDADELNAKYPLASPDSLLVLPEH